MRNSDDVIAIHQLMALYGHFLDQAQGPNYLAIGRAIGVDEVFTEDVVFEFAGARLDGREAIVQMERDAAETVPGHHVTNVYVYEADGEVRVHAKWFLADIGTGVVRTGDYHNVVVRTPEGWRIRHVDARVRFFPGAEPAIPGLG
jgi:hypothetical protein